MISCANFILTTAFVSEYWKAPIKYAADYSVLGTMLEFVDGINDYLNRVLGSDTGKLYEEFPESVKLAEDMETTCVRSFLHNVP